MSRQQQVIIETGYTLFIHFLEEYLNIKFAGFQSGFGIRPDMILFHAPSGSTLVVNTDVMLQPREAARAIIQNKIVACEAAFQKGVQ